MSCSCDCNYSCTCNCNYETYTISGSCTVAGNDCILYKLAFYGSNGVWYTLTPADSNNWNIHWACYGSVAWQYLPYSVSNDIVTIIVPSGVSITKICDIESVSGQCTPDNIFELDIVIPGVGSYVYKGSGALSPISIVPQSGSFQIYALGWINYCGTNPCTTNWYTFTPTPDWTDSPLLPGTIIKAQHVTELQEQINFEYKRRSVPNYSFPSLGSVVKYSDVYQLYNAISQLSGSLQWHENFATPLTGQLIRAINIEDLRDNINYLQTQCVCNCNYCTCNCNYACTCNCNYACTCNCAYCPCNCNYCTCNCNYCPCQSYTCPCDCHYCTQVCHMGSCFLAGTPVLAYDPETKHAFWKPVETFKVGDYVISADKGIPVRIKKIDKPILADRKIYGFTDGSLKWSSEHPFWTIDNSGKEWWWTVDPAIWRREIDLGETVGLRDNYSIRSGKDFKFATLNGFETKDFKLFEGYDPATPLYFPVAENGIPMIVAGYVSTGGTDEFSYGDYSTFKWDPEIVKKWLK